jgi:hypothetical protein
MTDFKRNIKFLAFAVLLFLFSYLNVYAGSANVSLNGASSVIVEKNIEIIVNLNNINVTDGVAGFQANIKYDSEYLSYVSDTSLASFGVGYTDSIKTIAGVAFMPSSRINGSSSNLIKLVFKTKKVGTTTISLSGTEVSEGNNSIASSNNPSKTITITPPPSSNANLSSLGVSNGSINFNKDTTNYSVKVGSDVTSINVSASAEDSGAKVSGTGSKSLNYGDNKINVVVTAPSGDKKTYTITVTREDNRSKNNNLSSIKLSTGTLSPSFSSGRTTYNVSVPFEVSSINVTATAEDAKAKVSVSGGSSLKAGKVTNVTIKVTAENGSVKTYTVKVTRGKDPNAAEEKNSNNNLASLNLGQDITLNPKFNKNTTSYEVEVPYKIKNLEIEAIPEDEAFAKVDITGADNLQVGENEVKIVVTAEDGKTKEYIIKVTRLEGTPEEIENDKPDDEKDVFEEVIPHLLKGVNISNGKLTSKFDSKKFVYYYKKNKGFKIEGIPNDEGDKVTIYERDGVITIVVGENLDEANVYTFIPKETNIVAIIITACSILFIGGGTFLGYKCGLKNINKPRKNKGKEVELPVFGE